MKQRIPRKLKKRLKTGRKKRKMSKEPMRYNRFDYESLEDFISRLPYWKTDMTSLTDEEWDKRVRTMEINSGLTTTTLKQTNVRASDEENLTRQERVLGETTNK